MKSCNMESLSFTTLLILCAAAGTESEQVIDRYGLKGKSFLLDVGGVKPAEFRRFYWKLNNTQTIVEYTLKNNEFEILPQFKEKLMFYETNFSLRILKLEESNRGIYTVITQDRHGKDKNIVIYRLIPQDSVIKPELKVKTASVSEDISVTCTVGQDNSVSYHCQQTHCTEVGRDYTELDALEIVVTVENSSIVCKASNRVSEESHWLALKDVYDRAEEKNRAKIIYAIPGSSLSLTVDVPGDLKMNMLEWMLKTENTEVTILKMATGGHTVFLYKNQVVFKETDYSLTLTNLSHRNSGIYTAVLSDKEDKKHRLNIYRVTVLAPSTFCIRP
ncbi:CD48 antigen-like [Lepisosteus oculatus]|uniref:CD48 antigen-like n=1 Tax=Lepisosteus oculatus TaxID=7918 RepID=UPI003717F9B0